MLGNGLERIYRMSRHIERAENVARFLYTNHYARIDLPPDRPPRWGPLLLAITDDAPLFVKRYGEASRENVIRFLAFDAENSSSILALWRAANKNARLARSALSHATTEELDEFGRCLERIAANSGKLDSPYHFCRQVMRSGHLLDGIINATLIHDQAWHVGYLGKLLERAEMTARMVHVNSVLSKTGQA